jgi:ADP-heptose:LPS heptosyltransferase
MTGEAPRSTAPNLPIGVLVDREGLGDALLRLPFLRAVKRAWPEHPVWWISSHETAMVHELAPWSGALIDRGIEHAGLTKPLWDVIGRLRALPPFDLIFDGRDSLAPVVLARLLLSHRGFYASLPYDLLSTRPSPRPVPSGVAVRMLSLVEAASGAPADSRGDFEIGSAAIHVATWRLPEGRTYVGLAVGGSDGRESWPLAAYIALAERLERAGRTPVFLIGPRERSLVEVLRASVPSALFPEADPIDPDITLRPLELTIAIGRRLAAAVADDSGIGHLLALVGTPLVGLFGPTDADRRRPFTSRGVVVRAQDLGGTTMEAIPVEPVFAAVEALIAGRTATA